jgi:hypothetical protein
MPALLGEAVVCGWPLLAVGEQKAGYEAAAGERSKIAVEWVDSAVAVVRATPAVVAAVVAVGIEG